MKEIIVLILFVKYRPLKYDECVKQLDVLKLDFFGYGTMIDNINNYINSIKKVLRGRPFLKKLAESLLVNWAVSYRSWCADITEGLESTPPTIKTWDLLFQNLRDKSKDASKAFKDGNILTGVKPDKPTKLKAVAAAGAATPDVVSAVFPLGPRPPTEGFECVGCKRKFTSTVPNPDVSKYQTHGWPTTSDGTKVLCDKKTFPIELASYAERRKGMAHGKKT